MQQSAQVDSSMPVQSTEKIMQKMEKYKKKIWKFIIQTLRKLSSR